MKYLYCVRNADSDEVCITSKKPNWSKWDDFGTSFEQWLFPDSKFWKSVHIDIFEKITGGRIIGKGKDSLIKLNTEKYKLLLKL